MSTTMYLNNAREIAAAAATMKELGYATSQRDLRDHDRYVMNIVSRFAGMDHSEQRELDDAIINAIEQVRL